jgi:hypothetical protein
MVPAAATFAVMAGSMGWVRAVRKSSARVFSLGFSAGVLAMCSRRAW